MGHGGGQVISVLAFDSDDPSSKLTEVNSFSVKFMFNRTKINKKGGQSWPILKIRTKSKF